MNPTQLNSPVLCIWYYAVIITCLSCSAESICDARGSKAKFPPPIPCPLQTSLCVLMPFAWAQNVSSDETAVRPQCAPHPPTRPYLLLLGEDGRSACHFRVDTRSPDSSYGFIMLSPLCLFCISIVFLSCWGALLLFVECDWAKGRHKISLLLLQFFILHCLPSSRLLSCTCTA